MQQVIKFEIEIFDVRTKKAVLIDNDPSVVSSIKINKSITLDNIAVITFAKSAAYTLLAIEHNLKLYNYVKIKLELKNYNPSNVDSEGNGKFSYFSGFIVKIDKSVQFGQSPTSTVSITISDYANLLKTTFYTRNLTFLEILNSKIDIFRMITLSDQLEDKNREMLAEVYSPTQLGFIMFVFLFYKFMYNIIYDVDGKIKKTSGSNSKEIFKKFKIYMPFGFDIPNVKNGTSMLKGQEQYLDIYRELQGVALDLFKYLYPEPIFEFSTYETKDSVILQIRFTPFMKFDRSRMSLSENSTKKQGSSFDVKSYNTIEKYEFGFDRIAAIEATGQSPADLLIKHLDTGKEGKGLIERLSKTTGQSVRLSAKELIANATESNLITEDLFKINRIDANYIESIAMSRQDSSVVNLIYTVPSTDTAVLRWAGKELVYANFEEKLDFSKSKDPFSDYLKTQFDDNAEPNPMFLINYKNTFGNDFVSGDMNYFGLREFEIKWNYLSIESSTIYHILNYVDTSILTEIRARSKDQISTRKLDFILSRRDNSGSEGTTSTPAVPRIVFQTPPPDFKNVAPSHVPYDLMRRSVRAEFSPKPSKNKSLDIKKALQDPRFVAAMEKFGLSTKDLSNKDKISQILADSKDKDKKLTAGLVNKINRVVGDAYRENEHLYECQILKPIDLSILPGQIVESFYKGSANITSPIFKGYVTSIAHNIDFNNYMMKTSFVLSRTASDDSGVVEK